MNNTQLKKLWDVLQTQEIAALSTNQEKADAINLKDKTAIRSLTSAEVLAWSAEGGRYTKFKNAITNPAFSDNVKSIAEVCLLLVQRDNTELDLNLPARIAIIDAAVASSLLTVDDRIDLYAAATYDVSTADQEGLGAVYTGHIEKAVAQLGGDS